MFIAVSNEVNPDRCVKNSLRQASGKNAVIEMAKNTNFGKHWLPVTLLSMAGILSACAPVPVQRAPQAPVTTAPVPVPPPPSAPIGPNEAAQNFTSVMRKMEPAVERECIQRRTQPINCDFQFVVDARPGLEPNAFQTVSETGRPIIGFTLSLIAATRNQDEVAFVVGHEASHHVLNHLERKSGASGAGAVILGSIAAAYGADDSAIQTAQQIGASVGSKYYSKNWELQADYLGAIMAMNAGYDPLRGADFFRRLPDPGDRVLGSHPSRASRLAQVQRAIDDFRSGRVR